MSLTALLPGSVSCAIWQMACRRVIKVGERVVKDLAGMCLIEFTAAFADRHHTAPQAVLTQPVELQSNQTAEKSSASEKTAR
jgi:hypothetical protein